MYKYTFNLAFFFFLKRLSEKSEITEAQNPPASEGSRTTTAEAGNPQEPRATGRRLLGADRNHRDKDQRK